LKSGVLVLTIGNELLDGRTVNTNAAYFGQKFGERGISVQAAKSISDDPDEIKEALLDAKQFKIIIVSGGLGPTNDDCTAAAAALAFSCPLVATAASVAHVRARYKARGKQVNKIRLKQSLLPKGAKLLVNARGTAPGFSIKIGSSHYYFLPGVPSECRPMFESLVLPFIKSSKTCHVRQVWRLFGLGEGDIYAKIKTQVRHLEKKYPESFRFGMHIAFPGVDLSLEIWRAQGIAEPSEAELDQLRQKIESSLRSFIFARTRTSLAEVVLQMLRERGLTLATAESCTGGMVGQALTDIAGSSDVFWGGVVSYSNAAKEKFLHVKPATLRRVGAVSEATAQEMAEGVRRISGADFGIALTGISGPGGGTSDKPVGTLYVSIAGTRVTKTLHRVLGSSLWSRNQNRTFAVHFALDSLRQELLG
jgi:nicotinamide-nucleotide amidase